jgi:dCMP deaminase
MSQATWDEYFIKMAFLVASKSKDTSTKVGVVIVSQNHEIRSTGYNDFPRNVKDISKRRERPEKYLWTLHSEINAICKAACDGIKTKNCIMYINWDPRCLCTICAGAIDQAGITEVVGPNRPFARASSTSQRNWGEDFKRTKKIFAEAGVTCRVIPFTES